MMLLEEFGAWEALVAPPKSYLLKTNSTLAKKRLSKSFATIVNVTKLLKVSNSN